MKNLSQVLAHLFHPRRSNNHRPRVIHTEGFFVLSITVVGFAFLIRFFNSVPLPGSFSTVLGFSSSITPAQVVEETNLKRIQSGLTPLTLDSKLTQAALAKGNDMIAKQYWAHTSPDGREPWSFISQSGYSYRVAGENLARDFSNTGEMMSAWMASPTHRANILNPKYSEIGIAVIDGRFLGYDTTLVIQMFGTPQVVSATINNEGQQIATVEHEATSEEQLVAGAKQTEAEVLAGAFVPVEDLYQPPLYTPLQLSKAFFLATIMLIMSTLIYDAFIMGRTGTVRFVGKNFAHILFFSTVAFILIFFKGGLIG